ncbi:hypothetical protein PAPYR_8591 [Paratrimastix pyriformis]|uniref:Uncharacterized protein n=1 Tax=Paratrimastix pyriformis TaxID=342808 RepID=A0ABQ8UDS1_9EUKA|nr:hypothetical protein PAPYR_8591 [Paratrimastix pyriformis]
MQAPSSQASSAIETLPEPSEERNLDSIDDIVASSERSRAESFPPCLEGEDDALGSGVRLPGAATTATRVSPAAPPPVRTGDGTGRGSRTRLEKNPACTLGRPRSWAEALGVMTVPQLEAVKSAISKWEGTDWAVALVGKGPREQLVVMLAEVLQCSPPSLTMGEVLDRAFTAADPELWGKLLPSCSGSGDGPSSPIEIPASPDAVDTPSTPPRPPPPPRSPPSRVALGPGRVATGGGLAVSFVPFSPTPAQQPPLLRVAARRLPDLAPPPPMPDRQVQPRADPPPPRPPPSAPALLGTPARAASPQPEWARTLSSPARAPTAERVLALGPGAPLLAPPEAALALQPVPQPVTATVPQPVPQPAQLAPVLAAPPIRGPQDPCIFVGVCEALAGILEAVLPDHPSQTPQTIRAVEGDLIWGPHRRFVWLSLGLPGPAGQERARGIGPETAD